MSDVILVPCPRCAGVNRIPRKLRRGMGKAVCGRCKQPLPLYGDAAEADDRTLPKLVAYADRPVIVDFWAEWCRPCRSFAATFEQAAVRLSDRFLFLKVNSDANPAAAARYGITSIPTLIRLSAGAEEARIAGALPLPDFVSWLRQPSFGGERAAGL